MGIKWNSGSLLDMEAHMPSATQNNPERAKRNHQRRTEFRPIKDSKGVEETREVALSVAKANTTINLDKDLNVHQLYVMEAKTTGINPSLENTLQTTEKEVQVLFKSLLSVQKQIDALINTSGNHSRDPWDFSKTAVYRAKASKLSMFVAFYFYSKSELVPDFGKTFTSILPETLAHDSSVPQAVGRGRAYRCLTQLHRW